MFHRKTLLAYVLPIGVFLALLSLNSALKDDRELLLAYFGRVLDLSDSGDSVWRTHYLVLATLSDEIAVAAGVRDPGRNRRLSTLDCATRMAWILRADAWL